MAITWTEKTAGQQGTSSQNYSTASTTPAANRVQLLFVASGLVGAAVAPTTVTGNGMTWTLVASQPTANNNVCLSVWRALSATPGAGAITMNFPVAHTGCGWKLLEANGASQAGSGGSGMIRAGSLVTGNSTSSAPALTLPTGTVIAGDGVICGINYNAAATQTLTAGSGFAKLGGADVDTSGSPAQLLSVEWATPGSPTVGWTTSNSNNKSLIAFEVVGASVAVTLVGPADQTVDAYDPVTMTWTASNGTAPYSHVIAQVAGSPSSTLAGTGGTRTFTAPAVITGAVQTFRDTVTDAATATAQDDTIVTTLAHNRFTQRAGLLVAHRPMVQRAGVLVG